MNKLIPFSIGALFCVMAAHGQERRPPDYGNPVHFARALEQATAPAPAQVPVPTILLYERHGHVVPNRQGCNHTGGGNIDVAQPTPDVVIVTMSGVAVAAAHPTKDSVASMQFQLDQCLELAGPPRCKLTMEARVIGLLRSHAAKCSCLKGNCGTAEVSMAHAALACDPAEIVAVSLEPHSVCCGENLSINDHTGPVTVVVSPGKYVLHQTFCIQAAHSRTVLPCKAASAEFAPDPALDPLWISYWEPFHGAIKKDFGFQVLLRIAPDATVTGGRP
jgi:hypothetical protein